MLCLYIIPAFLSALAAKWFLVANQSAGYHCKALHGIEPGYLRVFWASKSPNQTNQLTNMFHGLVSLMDIWNVEIL